MGGAHRDAKAAIEATGDVIAAALKDLGKKDGDTLVRERRQKYLDIGRQQN